MSVNDTTKLDYINNYFHQYFDINLNTNITTVDFGNLIIPVEKLFNLSDYVYDHTNEFHHDIIVEDETNINTILSNYSNTNIEKEVVCYCDRVIDGDTLDVNIPKLKEDGTGIEYTKKRVRLVGVDTPEQDSNGYESSKKMLEKICYTHEYYQEYVVKEERDETKLPVNDKKIYLNIDSKKELDNYGRTLAVLIFEDKNINEVLLKEGLARIMYIPPSEFNPYEWGDEDTQMSLYNFHNDSLGKSSMFFNSDFSNIVFTPQNDTTKLYRFEVYKGVIYLRMEPFSNKIRMHILPKGYDCSNQLLFFKDSMVDKRKIYQTESNPKYYKIYEDIEEINAYFQENEEDRDRTSAQSAQPPYDETGVETTFCEFDYDISEEANSYENIQICSGYNYNHTSPYYAIHYTGVKDEEQNRALEDRCSLIDGNVDEVKDKTNIITHMVYDDTINFPPYNDIDDLCKFGSTQQYHTNDENLYVTHHKVIKYINHDMYTEEDIDYTKSENNDNHCYAEWSENFE